MIDRRAAQQLLCLLKETPEELEFPPLDLPADESGGQHMSPPAASPAHRLRVLEEENSQMRAALESSLRIARGLLTLSVSTAGDPWAHSSWHPGDDMAWPPLDLAPGNAGDMERDRAP